MSVRDLKPEHLPMLKSIRSESLAAIELKFGIPRAQMRAFFHYPPTYWHLHVHFAHANMLSKASCFAGRAILLDDVIANLEEDVQKAD